MGLIRKQGIGEGMEITGKGRTIQLTILDIRGDAEYKTVKFGVKGLENMSELELSAQDNYFSLAQDIKIRVCIRQRTYIDDKGHLTREPIPRVMALVDYDAPKKDYHLQRKEFDSYSRVKRDMGK